MPEPELVRILVEFMTYDDDGGGTGMDSVERVRRTLATHPTLNFRVERVEREGRRSSCPDDLREQGLTVAVHNDYRQAGETMTFWLMTYQPEEGPMAAFKGEGRTDAEALDKIREAFSQFKKGQAQ